MSAPSAKTVARWLRRGGAALASLALDAALDSLELGKRCLAWVSHSATTRTVAIVALAIVVTGGAVWAAQQRRASEQAARSELGDAP